MRKIFIKVDHQIIRYLVKLKEIMCCDCHFDKVYFMLRNEFDYEKFQETFDFENSFCYFEYGFHGVLIIICYDTLKFFEEKKKFKKRQMYYRILAWY